MKKIIFTLILFLGLNSLYAETITLKTGKIVKGKIIEKNDRRVKIDITGTVVPYYMDEIASIGDAKEAESIKINIPEPLTTDFKGDRNEIVSKIILARKGTKRIQDKEIEEVAIKDFMHLVSEKFSDIDYEKKIIHNISEVKDCQFSLDAVDPLIKKMTQENVNSKLTPEQLHKRQEEINKVKLDMQRVMNMMGEKMKKMRNEVYIVGGSMYIHLTNKWVKMEVGFLDKFWAIILKAREGVIDENDFKDLYASTAQFSKESLAPLLEYIKKTTGQGSEYDLNTLAETQYLGKSAYALSLNNATILEAVKNGLINYTNVQKKKDLNLEIKSFKHRDFIDKDNYLKLASSIVIDLAFFNPEYGQVMTASSKTEILYDYPKDNIELSPELNQAVLVKDEEELGKIIAQEMKDMFKDLMPADKIKEPVIAAKENSQAHVKQP